MSYSSSTKKGGAGNEACKPTSMLGLADAIRGCERKNRPKDAGTSNSRLHGSMFTRYWEEDV